MQEGGQGRRTRRAARDAVGVFYDDYDEELPHGPSIPSGKSQSTGDVTAPGHTQVYYNLSESLPGTLPPTYFHYNDDMNAVGSATPSTAPSSSSTTTARQFNPDDYVDDNYEPFIDTPVNENKPTTQVVKQTVLTTPTPQRASVTAAYVDDHRHEVDAESRERNPFVIASLRAAPSADPYIPAARQLAPAEDEDYLEDDARPSTLTVPVTTAVTSTSTTSRPDGLASVLREGLAAMSTPPKKATASSTKKKLSTSKPATSSASSTERAVGSHRFRVSDKLLEEATTATTSTAASSPELTPSPTSTTPRDVPSSPPAPAATAGSPPVSSPLPTSTTDLPRTRAAELKGFFVCSGRELKTFYADPDDCHNFHYCSPGFTKTQVLDFRFRCEGGTVYQAESHRCAEGECPLRPTRPWAGRQ